MPTTSNFGWTTPADTDLVKDGAAAIRTLGNGIDTSLVDLKGGTTGQILSKASNTDLDYTWINNDQGDITAVTAGTGLTGGGTTGAVTLTNDMATTITASGDIVVGTGNGTYDNLPIGTTGQVLTADTTVSPYKVKWAAASSGGMTLLSTTTLSSTTTTISTISGSYTNLFISIENLVGSADNKKLALRFNGITAVSKYYGHLTYGGNGTTGGAFLTSAPGSGAWASNGKFIFTGQTLNTTGAFFSILVPSYTMTTAPKVFIFAGFNRGDGDSLQGVGALLDTTAAIDSLTVLSDDGTTTMTGTVKIYGVK